MFKNLSPDLVQSGKFGCPVLSGQETHMPGLVEPYVMTIAIIGKWKGRKIEFNQYLKQFWFAWKVRLQSTNFLPGSG